MELYYNGTDITAAVEIARLEVTEDMGRTPDGIDLWAANSQDQWSGWAPAQGDLLEVRHQGYGSGAMPVHQIEQRPGLLVLRAMSIPAAAQAKHTQVREGVTLPALTAELAARYGYMPLQLDPPSAVYSRLDQAGQGDFAFLAERAQLEGCHVKVTGGKVVLYSDQWMETQAPARTLGPGDLVEESRLGVQAQTHGGCTVTWGGIVGRCTEPAVQGPPLTIDDLPVNSQAEAERFARNILRDANRRAWGGSCTTMLDTGVTAGNTLRLQGMGMADGLYGVERVVHSFVEGVTDLQLYRIERGR